MRTEPSISRALRPALWCLVSFLAAASCSNIVRGESDTGDVSVLLSPRGTTGSVQPRNSEGASWGRTGLALGLTLAIVIGGMILAKKLLPGLAGATRGGPIQILCQAPLGTRGIVYALHCGPRILVVGATAGQLTTLAEISDPDEVDQFKQSAADTAIAPPRRRSEPMSRAMGGDLKGQLHGMLDKIENWNTQS